MSQSYCMDERLNFSRGLAGLDDKDTISQWLIGCRSVRSATPEEQHKGIDYVAECRGGAIVKIDAKRRDAGASRFWRHGEEDLALEIWSVMPNLFQTSEPKTGWTLSEENETDYVLFTFDPVDCRLAHFLPFQLLRIAFRRNFREWTSGRFDRKKQFSTRGVREWASEAVFVPASVVHEAITRASVISKEQAVVAR